MDEQIEKILSNNEMDASEKKNEINKLVLESMAADTGSEGEIQFSEQNEVMAMFSK
jgi:hypothetical protein